MLRGCTLSVPSGIHYCLLGGNGTGKTTMLKLLSGLYSPYRGELKVTGRVGALPQDPAAFEKAGETFTFRLPIPHL